MALRQIWIFLIIVLFKSQANGKTFRTDYMYNEEFDSYYKLHKTGLSWNDAKLTCHYEGAQFFFPDTKAEADYIIDHLYTKKNLDFPYIWLAISDIVAEGEYESVTGTLIEDLYINWEDGEPNNVNDNEDCIIFTKQGKMNDMPCNRLYPFVCKRTVSTIEWNILCDVPDLAYVYNNEMDKCYKFDLRPDNWDRAKTICEAEQSYLAVINNQKEADFLRNFTAQAPKNRYQGNYLAGAVHLGFYKEPKEETGKFITLQGKSLEEAGYARWSYNQPDNPKTEFCGSMFYDGELNDIGCTLNCYFICEHDLES